MGGSRVQLAKEEKLLLFRQFGNVDFADNRLARFGKISRRLHDESDSVLVNVVMQFLKISAAKHHLRRAKADESQRNLVRLVPCIAV